MKGFVIGYCCSSHEMVCCVFAFLCIRKWEDLLFSISLRSAYFFVSLFYSSTTCRFALLSLFFSFPSLPFAFFGRTLQRWSITGRVLSTWGNLSSMATNKLIADIKWQMDVCLSRWSDLLNLLSLSLEHDPILISSRWRSIGHASVLSRSSALRVVGSRQRRILIDLSIQSNGYERRDRSAMMNKRKELARD